MQRFSRVLFIAAASASLVAPAYAQIPTWIGFYQSNGKIFQTTMIGENPLLGHTTHIGVVLVPLTLRFNLGQHVFDPNQPQPGTSLSAVDWVRASPLFHTATFPNHPETILAPTQYLDAYQRSNFWNIVTGGSIDSTRGDFHILLDPPAIIPRTLDVPLWGGYVAFRDGKPLGRVYHDYLISHAASLLALTPSNFLTIILLDQVTMQDRDTGHLSGGFHTWLGQKTYTVSNFFFDSGDPDHTDIENTAHELAEWLVNPIGQSRAPGWVKVVTDECKHIMEVADPLESGGLGFTIRLTTDGPLFHLPDLAFESWFARSNPSPAFNGRVSFMGFPLPNPPCHQD